METRELVMLAEQVGFSHVGELNMGALDFREDVRAMCSDGKCHSYNTRWSCPPACGTLEHSRTLASKYRRGILVQTTGEMKSDFDGDAISQSMELHKRRFDTLVRQVRRAYPECLPMAAGACTRCKKCTYPDRPCRYPDRMYTSMEAYGLLVNDVCTQSGLKYEYGAQTITYSSCILID